MRPGAPNRDPSKAPPRCRCQARLDANGRCPYGCPTVPWKKAELVRGRAGRLRVQAAARAADPVMDRETVRAAADRVNPAGEQLARRLAHTWGTRRGQRLQLQHVEQAPRRPSPAPTWAQDERPPDPGQPAPPRSNVPLW